MLSACSLCCFLQPQSLIPLLPETGLGSRRGNGFSTAYLCENLRKTGYDPHRDANVPLCGVTFGAHCPTIVCA